MQNEDNLDELVRLVFSRPPQRPKTIQLQMDVDCQEPDVIPLIFSDIALRGARALFGIEDVMTLNREQARLVDEYMRSMGVTMKITCNFTGEDPYEMSDQAAVQSIQISFQWC